MLSINLVKIDLFFDNNNNNKFNTQQFSVICTSEKIIKFR